MDAKIIHKKNLSEKSSIIITRRKNGTKRVQTINLDDSLTDQSFAEDCDINCIIAKFKKTGEFNHKGKQGVYMDASEIPDLATAFNQIKTAEQALNQLPAEVREKFANDPLQMAEWLQDPKNQEEGIKLGLLLDPTLQQKNDELNDEKFIKKVKTVLDSSSLPKQKDPPAKKPDQE